MTFVGSSEPPRKSIVKPILIGCGVLCVLGFVGTAALIVWLASGPAGGVKMENEMHSYALKYLAKHKILNDSEQLLAYYDETTAMNGTEAAILTTERVMYHKDGRTTAVRLSDITDVQHHYETLNGDIIEVVSKNGGRMTSGIPPLNDGELFLRALNEARARVVPAPAEERG